MHSLKQTVAEMTAWRHDLHAAPEFGFEERRTAALVADRLRSFGVEVAEGLGGTGVVGTLKRGHGNRAIALRADMDALRIAERNTLPYASARPGLMHACGHDGHTAMLLGAARTLAEEGGFDGAVHFVFQPAEAWGQGALAMLGDGLLRRFPFDEIYGLHNLPGLAVGRFQTRPGAIMAAEDIFEIRVGGVGGHAARPHHTREVMLAACSLVVNLQAIVARRIDPAEIAVVSVTEIVTDGTRNALPGTATIRGDARSMKPDVSSAIESEMRRIAAGTAQTHDCAAEVDYRREFVPLLNSAEQTAAALAAASSVFGPDAVDGACEPIAASEDFARFVAHVPGNFAFIGNGEASAPLHSPNYDFNDEALVHGASYFVSLVRQRLAPAVSGRA